MHLAVENVIKKKQKQRPSITNGTFEFPISSKEKKRVQVGPMFEYD